MNASTMSSIGKSADLHGFSGLLVLVGAGKMGGALLEGWLRLGLDPTRLAVIEPSPTPQISALAVRGVRLNPDVRALTDVAAIVIAVKPQIAAEVLPALASMIQHPFERYGRVALPIRRNFDSEKLSFMMPLARSLLGSARKEMRM